MSITLTTTPLSTEDILVEWSYSTFDEATDVEFSATGLDGSYASITGSPFALGVGSAVASGLTEATKYYFRIKKTVWVGYTKANGDTDTLLEFKTGLNFDGVNDYVDIDSSIEAQAIPDELTISFWVNFRGSVGNLPSIIWQSRQLSNQNMFGIRANSNNSAPPSGKQNIYIAQTTTGALAEVATIEVDLDSDWHLYVATRKLYSLNVTRYEWDIYWDKVLVLNTNSPTVVSFPTAYQEENSLGSAAPFAQYGLNGDIDNFYICEENLNQADVDAVWNGGVGSNYLQSKSPKIAYKFDEAVDDVSGNGGGGDNTGISAPPEIQDASGNGYHATMQSFTKNGAVSNWVDSIDVGLDVFSVTPLTTTSITFTVDANPTSLDVEFEYSKLEDFSVIDGTGSTSTSIAVTGLDLNALYYFRAQNTGMSGYFKVESSYPLYDFGLALKFDGTNDKVVIDTSWNDIPMPQNWSASVWVNFLGSGALDQAIWHNRKTGVESQLNWQVNTPNSTGFPGSPAPTGGLNTVTFQFTKGTGSGGLTHVYTTIPIDSLWYNFIVTREFKNATVSTTRLYQNGVEVFSFDVDTVRFATVYGERTEIGTQSDVRWMNGNMDNFSIIHDTITPTEAIEIYNGGLGGTTIRDHPSLFYLADFNTVGAVGGGTNTGLTTMSDQSGNGYDGTLTNFALSGADSNYVDH